MEAYEKTNIFLKHMEAEETEEDKDEVLLEDEDLAEINLPEDDEDFDDDEEEDLLAVDPLLVSDTEDDEDDDEYLDFDTFDDIDE